ncbi:hypothetical protein BHAOGJBA_4461 [Methylobacterium hispanicum]|uniref:Uncharacterized protein n=1 Tax=Methylobacterium hispanicum TaxID=270350 RepID=A0AAV4ZRU1_9HYPH|nr:hypothetical protein [Methylobacterium hispanicum]GJD90917.1 hypothetical protein BHAOGJBA_4461 [Methylobacterium hispanicum]
MDFPDDDASAPAADPFVGRDDQDELLVRFVDGRRIEGSLMRVAGMTFLQVRDGTMMGHAEGPFDPSEIASIAVLRTRQEVFDARYERQRGDPVPGQLVRTRDGYETRLDRLAKAAAYAEDGRRRRQIRAQFDDVADEIALAKTKRNWLMSVASWYRYSNQEPTKIDLSGGCMTTAMTFQRPRPQDFDPDPKVRRARVPVPEQVAADPLSTWNMMRVLRSFGYDARASVLGDVTWDAAGLLVDFPGGREKGRFSVEGKRDASGAMTWTYFWDGNGSAADNRRRIRCQSGGEYRTFRNILAYGALMPGFVDKGAATYRADVLVDDPQAVAAWLAAHAEGRVARKLARETDVGWHCIAVFTDAETVVSFRADWRCELATEERIRDLRRERRDRREDVVPSPVP